MPKLTNFTINTNYPATAKTGSGTATITMPATSFSGGQDRTFTADFSVPSGAILMPIIQQGSTYYVGNGYAWRNDNWNEEVWLERLSDTQLRLVFYVVNTSASTLTHPGNTITAHISTFIVP